MSRKQASDLRDCWLIIQPELMVVVVVPCTAEPPQVFISGTNNGNPVSRGESVTLNCSRRAGIPNPTLAFERVGGGRLPPSAVVQQFGSYVTLTFPSFSEEEICVRCVGTNLLGIGEDQTCLKLDGKFIKYCVGNT